jgi:hypothetical protein
MNAGDRIQIRQLDVLPDSPAPRGDPPVVPGPIELWVYARVKEQLEDGRVRVIVEHPGNRAHGAELLLEPIADDGKTPNLRTKADVQKLAAATHHPTNPGWDARIKKHFQIQADRLT